MNFRRADRVSDELQRELSDIILRRMKDPRIGYVTITGVEVSKDIRYAKVYVSVLGDAEARATTMDGLARATGFIRTELGRRVRLRYVPEILFRYDESIEQGTRIDQLLREIRGSET